MDVLLAFPHAVSPDLANEYFAIHINNDGIACLTNVSNKLMAVSYEIGGVRVGETDQRGMGFQWALVEGNNPIIHVLEKHFNLVVDFGVRRLPFEERWARLSLHLKDKKKAADTPSTLLSHLALIDKNEAHRKFPVDEDMILHRIDRLGRGQNWTVFAVFDVSTGKTRALKVGIEWGSKGVDLEKIKALAGVCDVGIHP